MNSISILKLIHFQFRCNEKGDVSLVEKTHARIKISFEEGNDDAVRAFI